MDKKLDPYFKKTISFKYEGEELIFNVSQELFSSQIVDLGTQRLLRTLSTEKPKFTKALDLGCGYGPIGLTLKKIFPESVVQMVDIDALAVRYSLKNAKINHLCNMQIYGSLGFDSVKDRDFDLIISNIPAKVGEKALSHLILDPRFYLQPNGRVAIVVIDSIVQQVSTILQSDKDIEILFQKSWPGHTVFHYRFVVRNEQVREQGTAIWRGIYDRTQNEFLFNKRRFLLKTTYNLPEFNTLSFETKLLLDNLKRAITQDTEEVIIFNPGQGYIPLALSTFAKINKIILVDRNLQSLEVSKRNLMLNNYPEEKILLFHQVGILIEDIPGVNCILGIIPEKQNKEVYEMLIKQSAQQLTANGMMMFISSSNVISKLERIINSDKNFIVSQKTTSKGKKLIISKLKDYKGWE